MANWIRVRRNNTWLDSTNESTSNPTQLNSKIAPSRITPPAPDPLDDRGPYDEVYVATEGRDFDEGVEVSSPKLA